ncbi:N-chimaerin [Homalodisca vitripennis]|nr:N-chimaerin [Homalodisca vitripennis]
MLPVYRIQQEAPRPRAVVCGWSVAHTPPEYGNVFHGALSHGEAASILSQDGDYLVRLSGHIYTLSLRFKGKVKHYKLYYDGQHYVKDKRFGTLAELVADGLLTLHMECEAGPYIVLMSDMHYVKDKRFGTLAELVADGLLTLLMECEAGPYIVLMSDMVSTMSRSRGLGFWQNCLLTLLMECEAGPYIVLMSDMVSYGSVASRVLRSFPEVGSVPGGGG